MLRSSKPATSSSQAVRATRSSSSSRGMPRFSQVNATSDVASVVKNWLRGSWNTLPTRATISSALNAAVSRPSRRTSPTSSPSKNRGASPFTRRVAVVLPQPDRPHSTTNSPGATARSNPRRLGSAADA